MKLFKRILGFFGIHPVKLNHSFNEVRLSECPSGCKEYVCYCHPKCPYRKPTLIHNTTYGCRRGQRH